MTPKNVKFVNLIPGGHLKIVNVAGRLMRADKRGSVEAKLPP